MLYQCQLNYNIATGLKCITNGLRASHSLPDSKISTNFPSLFAFYLEQGLVKISLGEKQVGINVIVGHWQIRCEKISDCCIDRFWDRLCKSFFHVARPLVTLATFISFLIASIHIRLAYLNLC